MSHRRSSCLAGTRAGFPDRTQLAASLPAAGLFLACFLSTSPLYCDDAPWFVRGDSDANGQVDLSDAVSLLAHLFAGEPPPPCLRAADVNADDTLDLSDPVTLLSFLFLGRGAPPPPFPECGRNTAEGARLSCEKFEPCSGYDRIVLDDAHAASAAQAESLEVLTPFLPGTKPIATVSPELARALRLLAAGESLLALQDVPGFEDFMESSDVLSGIRAGQEDDLDYIPTVEIRSGPNTAPGSWLDGHVLKGPPPSPSFRFDAEVLDRLNRSLGRAGFLESGARIVAAEPPEVQETGRTPVLVVRQQPDGREELLSCLLELLPDGELELWIRRKPCVDLLSREPDACEWYQTGPDPYPAKHLVKQREYTWSLAGTPLETSYVYTGRDPGPGRGADGWRICHGPGPWYEIRNWRGRANCHAPETHEALVCCGRLSVNLNVVCFDKEGRKYPAEGCESTVHHAARYESTVQADTRSGAWCPLLGANDIEAIAKDEARYLAFPMDAGKESSLGGGQVIFNKGAIVHNGTEVTSKLGFDLQGGADVKPAQGLAAHIGVSVGYSETVRNETGTDKDSLSCTGQGSLSPPLSLLLETKGNATLNARNKTLGRALTQTRLVALYFVATSRCRLAGKRVGGFLACVPSFRDNAVEAADDLFRDFGLIDEDIVWEPWQPEEEK